MKHKSSGREWGFQALHAHPSRWLDEVLDAVTVNRIAIHDGILVQAPCEAMGKGATQRVFDAIAVEKDVDGFAPKRGLLSQNANNVACKPPA